MSLPPAGGVPVNAALGRRIGTKRQGPGGSKSQGVPGAWNCAWPWLQWRLGDLVCGEYFASGAFMKSRNSLNIVKRSSAVILIFALGSLAFIASQPATQYASAGVAFAAIGFCYLLLVLLALFRWFRFRCPACHQYFFVPAMHRPASFVSYLFARRCCNCHAPA